MVDIRKSSAHNEFPVVESDIAIWSRGSARACGQIVHGSKNEVTFFSTFIRSAFMKIFSNASFKSLAAAAAVLLFASSAVYAACPPQSYCGQYAAAKAGVVRTSTYNQVYESCMHTPYMTEWNCRDAAERESENAYNTAYNSYYANCMNGNCV